MSISLSNKMSTWGILRHFKWKVETHFSFYILISSDFHLDHHLLISDCLALKLNTPFSSFYFVRTLNIVPGNNKVCYAIWRHFGRCFYLPKIWNPKRSYRLKPANSAWLIDRHVYLLAVCASKGWNCIIHQ